MPFLTVLSTLVAVSSLVLVFSMSSTLTSMNETIKEMQANSIELEDVAIALANEGAVHTESITALYENQTMLADYFEVMATDVYVEAEYEEPLEKKKQ